MYAQNKYFNTLDKFRVVGETSTNLGFSILLK